MMIDSGGRWFQHPDVVGWAGGLLIAALTFVATGVVSVSEPWRVVAIVALVVVVIAWASFMAYIVREIWTMGRHPERE